METGPSIEISKSIIYDLETLTGNLVWASCPARRYNSQFVSFLFWDFEEWSFDAVQKPIELNWTWIQDLKATKKDGPQSPFENKLIV